MPQGYHFQIYKIYLFQFCFYFVNEYKMGNMQKKMDKNLLHFFLLDWMVPICMTHNVDINSLIIAIKFGVFTTVMSMALNGTIMSWKNVINKPW